MHPIPRRTALALLLSAALGTAQADSTPQTLPFSQSWSDQALIATNDDWSGVPGITGFRGDNLTGATGADPQTLLDGDDPGVADVNPNQTNPSTYTAGGVTEFHLAADDAIVGLTGSGTADAPYLKVYLNTLGATGITVAYTIRDLDGSADDATQQVALQYRVGGSGAFTNVPAAYVADATTANTADQATPVSVLLPADADNQALVELRIITSNAAGSDEYIGIDDISVTAGGGGGTPVINVGSTSVTEGDAGTSPAFFTISLSQPAGPGGVSFLLDTADGTAIASEDYLATSVAGTIAEGVSSTTVSLPVLGDTTVEADETFTVNLSNVSGAIEGNLTGTGTIVNDDFVLVPISQVQGNGQLSPFDGQEVVVEGIVTGRKNNGFFLQTADGADDGDDATSEGIYVFTSSAPPATAAVGNRVRVQATVDEYIPSADPYQLPLTELTFATVVQVATGQALPAPVALAADSVLPDGGLAQLEHLEGMRVTAPSFTVVAPTRGNTDENDATGGSNGQFAVVVTGVDRPLRESGIQVPDPDPSGTTATDIPRWDFNPETIAVDSDAIGAPRADLAAGCRIVDGTLTGPLDYTFRRYTIYPEAALAVDCDGLDQPRPSLLPSEDHATFATYNLQRFFDTANDPETDDPVLTPVALENRLNKASLGIRAYMHAPDIVGVSEVENLGVLQQLAAKINADAVAAGQPDPGYVAYLEEGNDVGGIDVGFLAKSGQVAPAGVVGGTPRVQVLSVAQQGADESWVYPGTGESSLLNDRPPLVMDALVNFADGRQLPITAIVVHQRSLSGVESEDPEGSGTNGDRVRQKRQKQAEYLAGLVQGMQQADATRNLVVLGDFNAFEFNDGYADALGTVTGEPSADDETAVNGDGAILVDPALYNATFSAPAEERYSFVFENTAQSLDHILLSWSVLTSPLVNSMTMSHARLNADFPETARNDADTPTRLSDHDPSVLLLRLNALSFADLSVQATATQASVAVGGTLSFEVEAGNAGPDAAQFPGVGFALDAQLADLAVAAPSGWSCDPATVGGGETTAACTADTLASAATAAFTVTATAPASAAGGTVALNAAVTSQTEDPDAGNDSDSAEVAVEAQADLQVGVDGPATLQRGATGVYEILVDNVGPASAVDAMVQLSANVPAGSAAVAAPVGWNCTALPVRLFAATCTTEAGTLASGTSTMFEVTVPTGGRLFPPRFSVRASAASAVDDPAPADNADMATSQLVR